MKEGTIMFFIIKNVKKNRFRFFKRNLEYKYNMLNVKLTKQRDDM